MKSGPKPLSKPRNWLSKPTTIWILHRSLSLARNVVTKYTKFRRGEFQETPIFSPQRTQRAQRGKTGCIPENPFFYVFFALNPVPIARRLRF